MSGAIKTSMVMQVGEHEGRVLVSISAVASVGEHTRSKVLSAAAYDDHPAAWRAIRDFATQRLLADVEELVTRPTTIAEPVRGEFPESPF